jgi:ComF family protein
MNLRDKLTELFKDFASAFMPFSCHLCETSTDFGKVLCPDCHKKLEATLHPPQIVNDTRCNFAVYTLSSYSSLVADIIRIIKYRPSARLLKILSQSCNKLGKLNSLLRNEDVIVPVPMHSRRLSDRGFNQAEALANGFAATAHCHFCPALKRIRATRPQADCNEEDRRHNLEGAFALDSGLKLSEFTRRRVVLVDDVATTGSTLQLCADVLKELNPAEICALVVSHSYKQKQ